MTEWTAHKFSGGVLALDLANTVVWQDDLSRRTDRLKSLNDATHFARAAAQYSDFDTPNRKLIPPKTVIEFNRLIALRNAIDGWLRPIALGVEGYAALPQLLKSSWKSTQYTSPAHLEYACALSAVCFFQPAIQIRVKVCPACRWLFLDKSKNQSRRWCDMKVCGNRAKARTHYELHAIGTQEVTS